MCVCVWWMKNWYLQSHVLSMFVVFGVAGRLCCRPGLRMRSPAGMGSALPLQMLSGGRYVSSSTTVYTCPPCGTLQVDTRAAETVN